MTFANYSNSGAGRDHEEDRNESSCNKNSTFDQYHWAAGTGTATTHEILWLVCSAVFLVVVVFSMIASSSVSNWSPASTPLKFSIFKSSAGTTTTASAAISSDDDSLSYYFFSNNIVSAAAASASASTTATPLSPTLPPTNSSLLLLPSPDHPNSTAPSPARLSSSPIILPSRENILEKGLAKARAAVRKAGASSHRINSSAVTAAHIYRNPAAFFQSYVEMEKRFKVYIYEEGEVPIVHYGPCKNIYAIEGRFIHQMEQEQGRGNRFRTRDPHSAHVYFMPFSVTWMVKFLYKPNTFNVTPLKQFASDYIRVISTKHPFWNRTQGADHFMLSCHDWGPHASRGNPFLYNTSIRVLCNANSSEGFNPRKDVSLPEIHLYDGDVSRKIRTPPPPNRSTHYLAFFAGGKHGPIRPILFQHWKDRDADIHVYEYLPKGLDYYSFMLESKFCLCPSGYEVASPRIVEAIYAECVPVILSNHYVLPFSDVLRWEAFSIKVEVSEIPRLKEILMAVPDDKYQKLKEGLRAVRKHFVLNQPAQRFDMFHMILHSVWLRRMNLRLA